MFWKFAPTSVPGDLFPSLDKESAYRVSDLSFITELLDTAVHPETLFRAKTKTNDTLVL